MTRQTTGDWLLRYWPIILSVVAVVGAATTGQMQLAAHAEDIAEAAKQIEKNENSVEEIQRALIRRQGEIALDLQRIEHNQKQQEQQMGEIIEILRDIERKD